MSERQAVLFVNDAFYAAFDSRDFKTMDMLWALKAEVHCIHPGAAPLHGREAVMDSWRAILEGSSMPGIRCHETRALVIGEAAVVTCFEQVGEGWLAATNCFCKEAGAWKLVHHQAGPCSEPPEDTAPIEGSGAAH